MTRTEIAALAMQGLLVGGVVVPSETNESGDEAERFLAHTAVRFADALLVELRNGSKIPPPAEEPEEKGGGNLPVTERPAGERTFADAICEIALVAAEGFAKAEHGEIACRRALERIAEIVGAVADEARLARGGARAAG